MITEISPTFIFVVYIEKKGEEKCKTGSMIRKQSECKSACDKLNKKEGTLWKAAKPCVLRANGVCGQKDGPPTDPGVALICKKLGY